MKRIEIFEDKCIEIIDILKSTDCSFPFCAGYKNPDENAILCNVCFAIRELNKVLKGKTMKRIELTSKVILTLSGPELTKEELASAIISAEQYLNSLPGIENSKNEVYFRFHFDKVTNKKE